MSQKIKSNTPRYGLRFKVTAMMSALFITLSLILSWFTFSRTMASLRDELKRRGSYLAKTLAYNGEHALAAGDNRALTAMVRNLSKESDVAYAAVLDPRGKILVH